MKVLTRWLLRVTGADKEFFATKMKLGRELKASRQKYDDHFAETLGTILKLKSQLSAKETKLDRDKSDAEFRAERNAASWREKYHDAVEIQLKAQALANKYANEAARLKDFLGLRRWEPLDKEWNKFTGFNDVALAPKHDVAVQ